MKYDHWMAMDVSDSSFAKIRKWAEQLVELPLGIFKSIPIETQDIKHIRQFLFTARNYLDACIYGQEDAKNDIINYLARRIRNPNAPGKYLAFIGPPGVGKTSLAQHGISKALGFAADISRVQHRFLLLGSMRSILLS